MRSCDSGGRLNERQGDKGKTRNMLQQFSDKLTKYMIEGKNPKNVGYGGGRG